MEIGVSPSHSNLAPKPKNSKACSNCGCTDFETQQSTGQISCTNCGRVIATSEVVNECTFSKNDNGTTSLNAAFVSAENGISSSVQHSLGFRSHRLQTENQARHEISRCCYQLGANAIVEPAFNYFKMAMTRKLTRGRRIEYTIGACLYLACRQDNHPFMLIDFADELDIDVFHLGRAYQLLSDALVLSDRYNCIDPTIYIDRLVAKLDFKEQNDEVRELAVRLVKRMKRDWIDRGRRPTGLCGAAILMAARAQDFQICFADIARVAKIGHATIKKRLDEFENTQASDLSIDDFNKYGDDIEKFGEAANPPSFKHEIESKIDKTWANNEGMKVGLVKLADLLEQDIENSQKKKEPRSRKGTSTSNNSENSEISEKQSAAVSLQEKSNQNSSKNSKNSSPGKDQGQGQNQNVISESEAINFLTNGNDEKSLLANPVSFLTGKRQNYLTKTDDPNNTCTPAKKRKVGQDEGDNEDQHNTSLIDSLKPTLKDYGVIKSGAEQFKDAPDFLEDTSMKKKDLKNQEPSQNSPTKSPIQPDTSSQIPSQVLNHPNLDTNLQNGLNESQSDTNDSPKNQSQKSTKNKNHASSKSTNPEQSDQIDNFSDIDDDEIDYYILSAHDVKIKTDLWEKENGKIYDEVLAREKKRIEEKDRKKREEEELFKQGIRPKKRRPNNGKNGHLNAGIAIAQIIQTKKISKKVNYKKLVDGCLRSTEVEKEKSNPGDPGNQRKNVNVGNLASGTYSKQSSTNYLNSRKPSSIVKGESQPPSVVSNVSKQPWTPATPAEFPSSGQAGYSSASETETETEDEDAEIMNQFHQRQDNDDDE